MSLKQFVAAPDMRSMLNVLKNNILLSLNCHAIARVVSFDEAQQTVTAEMMYQKSLNGKLVEYPVMIDCPVIILSGGLGRITFPIEPGDTCWMMFNDRDMDSWFESGQKNVSLVTPRLHAFTDAVALIGLRAKPNAIDDYDTERVVISNDEAKIAIGAEKIEISNDTQNLNDLLQDLCTQLQNLITQIGALTVTCSAPASPSSIPINSAAILAIGTQLAATATDIGALLE